MITTNVPGADSPDYLVFDLGGHRFAVRAGDVREVVRAASIAELPGAPGVVEGAVNVRGEVLPVLDVRARFGVAARPLDPSQHFVVTRAGDRAVVLRVDRVLEIARFDRDAIAPAESLVNPGELVAGVARTDDGLVVVHDLGAFLSESERRALDARAAAGGRGDDPA